MNGGRSWPRTLLVNDWYEVLGVAPSASSEEIAAAYRRLVPLERNPNESEDEAETRRLREYAYGVLSNPDSRARYDAERAAATAPPPAASQEPAAGGAAAPRTSGIPLGPLVAALGIVAAIFAVVALVLVVVANDDDGEEAFPDRDNEEYDLEAMRLRDQDMPTGFEWVQSVDFNNEEWGQLFLGEEELEDPEALAAKQRELDSEGRIRNLLSVYQPEGLGRTVGIFSISTLYDDDDSASESLTLFCGLPVDERQGVQLRPVQFPRVGDESSGFISEGVMSGPQFSETTFCFRTGRVVHAVSLASLPGIEDIGLAVRLAEDMEDRVEAFYDGEEPPEDDLDNDAQGGSDGG
jgi:curved DNA-binding protein CbpA